jgi:hypothetical protein
MTSLNNYGTWQVHLKIFQRFGDLVRRVTCPTSGSTPGDEEYSKRCSAVLKMREAIHQLIDYFQPKSGMTSQRDFEKRGRLDAAEN